MEWRSTFATVGGGVQRGEVACGNGIATSRTRGEGIRSEPEAHFDLGEHTLLFYVQRLGGADDAMPLALVARRHDGKAIDVKAYIHRADALNDLGRS